METAAELEKIAPKSPRRTQSMPPLWSSHTEYSNVSGDNWNTSLSSWIWLSSSMPSSSIGLRAWLWIVLMVHLTRTSKAQKESETQAITRKDETTSSFLLSVPSKNDLKKQIEKPSGQYIYNWFIFSHLRSYYNHMFSKLSLSKYQMI